ncbi:MAG: hypothetical protein ABJA71_08055 [Ginsengibacter sp.]
MLSCKKILAAIVAPALFCGCMEQKLLFDFKRDVNDAFFREIPGIGAAKYFGNNVTKKASKAEIYVSSFREKFIEKDNLLEYTELNDESKIQSAPYWEVNGYSQNLYLLRYQFAYTVTQNNKSFDVPVEAAIFFTLKFNNKSDVIGVVPCYFGIIDRENNLISFENELLLQKDNGSYYLKMLKRKNDVTGLLFMPANFSGNPVESETKLNIKKIVKLDAK